MRIITKTNHRSVDIWDRFDELGKKVNHIRNVVDLLMDRREDIVKEFENENPKINLFSDDNYRFSFSFDNYLNKKLAEIIKSEAIAEINGISKEIITRFKVELFNFFRKRISQKYLCEIKFEDGFSLYKAFEALETINKRAVFQIFPKGINVYAINESKTSLAMILLDVKEQNFLFLRHSELLINISDMVKNLKCYKSENITTILRFEENALKLELFSKEHKSRISRIIKDVKNNFEKENIIDELMKIKYPGFFVLDKSKFFHILSQMGRISEIINLKLTNNTICFSECDSQGSGEIKWDKNSIPEINVITNDQNKQIIDVYFSSENLKCFAPFLFEDFPLIKFYIKEKVPIKLLVDFNSLENSSVLFFLAQRDCNSYE